LLGERKPSSDRKAVSTSRPPGRPGVSSPSGRRRETGSDADPVSLLSLRLPLEPLSLRSKRASDSIQIESPGSESHAPRARQDGRRSRVPRRVRAQPRRASVRPMGQTRKRLDPDRVAGMPTSQRPFQDPLPSRYMERPLLGTERGPAYPQPHLMR